MSLDDKTDDSPTMGEKTVSFGTDMVKWAHSGLQFASKYDQEERLSICRCCEFFDHLAFFGKGKCTKCGCIAKLKLKLATSSCPLGLWGPVFA
jgi:hypothetical protein